MLIVTSLRPRQWLKNLVVFAALIFAQRLGDPEQVIRSVLGFLLFCATSGAIYIQAGTIYPILRNLESQGLIEHIQERSVRGPPRKCYNLTDEGETALEELDQVLDGFLGAVAKVRETSVGQ